MVSGYAHRATSSSLSPQSFEALQNLGWRRVGRLLHCPDTRQSCCAPYLVQLDVRDFKPSRDQRQTINRFTRYILGDAYIKEANRQYPKSREEAQAHNNTFSLLARIHEPRYMNVKLPPEPAHRFEVTLEDDCFTVEKHQVYSNYKETIHNAPPEERSATFFRQKFCESPLRTDFQNPSDGEKLKLGSYHQCYRLDGKLVAVGVLDILPDCINSVCFFLLDEVRKHCLGKLSVLYEIALALEGGWRWWTSGDYVHDCSKVQYKLDYEPQYVLEPDSLQWLYLDKEILKSLKNGSFSRL